MYVCVRASERAVFTGRGNKQRIFLRRAHARLELLLAARGFTFGARSLFIYAFRPADRRPPELSARVFFTRDFMNNIFVYTRVLSCFNCSRGIVSLLFLLSRKAFKDVVGRRAKRLFL